VAVHLSISISGQRFVELLRQFARVFDQCVELEMSYRRAWLLVNEMNRGLVHLVVDAMTGGNRGGGPVLTSTVLEIIKRYPAIEKILLKAAVSATKVCP
jgi:molybdate transport system regulatory protein